MPCAGSRTPIPPRERVRLWRKRLPYTRRPDVGLRSERLAVGRADVPGPVDGSPGVALLVAGGRGRPRRPPVADRHPLRRSGRRRGGGGRPRARGPPGAGAAPARERVWASPRWPSGSGFALRRPQTSSTRSPAPTRPSWCCRSAGPSRRATGCRPGRTRPPPCTTRSLAEVGDARVVLSVQPGPPGAEGQDQVVQDTYQALHADRRASVADPSTLLGGTDAAGGDALPVVGRLRSERDRRGAAGRRWSAHRGRRPALRPGHRRRHPVTSRRRSSRSSTAPWAPAQHDRRAVGRGLGLVGRWPPSR